MFLLLLLFFRTDHNITSEANSQPINDHNHQIDDAEADCDTVTNVVIAKAQTDHNHIK